MPDSHVIKSFSIVFKLGQSIMRLLGSTVFQWIMYNYTLHVYIVYAVTSTIFLQTQQFLGQHVIKSRTVIVFSVFTCSMHR